jgi:hypothetical protein
MVIIFLTLVDVRSLMVGGRAGDAPVWPLDENYPRPAAAIDSFAAATAASGVMPNSLNSVAKSADAPKCSSEIARPVLPSQRHHGWDTPASIDTRAVTAAGKTDSM